MSQLTRQYRKQKRLMLLLAVILPLGTVLYNEVHERTASTPHVEAEDNNRSPKPKRKRRARKNIYPVEILATESAPPQAPVAMESQNPELAVALDFFASGQWENAESALKEAIQKDPENANLWVRLADVSLSLNQDSGIAKGYLEKAARMDPSNRESIEGLLRVYERSGNYGDGLAFLQSLSETGKNPVLDYGMAQVLQKLGRNEEALEHFVSVSEDPNTDQRRVRIGLADAFIELGIPEKAISLLRDIDRNLVEQYESRDIEMNLAKAFLRQGDETEAQAITDSWLQGNPSDLEFAHFALERKSEVTNPLPVPRGSE